MQQQPNSSKKKYLIAGTILGVVGLFGLANNSQNQPKYVTEPDTSTAQTESANTNLSTEPTQAQAQPPAEAPASTPAPNSSLSNSNYYTNVDGNEVHSPAYSDTVPDGATARCGDGTYSFSQHRSGTCSHHGGVAEWL